MTMVLSEPLRTPGCRLRLVGLAVRAVFVCGREPGTRGDPGAVSAPRCPLDVIFTYGAGWAVQTQTSLACRVTPEPTGQQADGIRALRDFGLRPLDVLAVSEGRAAVGGTQVAMERPGGDGPPPACTMAGRQRAACRPQGGAIGGI